MIRPKVGEVPRTIPTTHQIDITTFGIDAHLMTAPVPWCCLWSDGIEWEMVVMCPLTMAVRPKAFPDGLVIVCLNVLVKEPTFGSLTHKFLRPFEIPLNDQLPMQTGQGGSSSSI